MSLARLIVTSVLGLGLGATPALAERVVAIAPLSTLGAEDTSAATKQLLAQIEGAAAALPDTKVITVAQVTDAIKKAKQPQLRVCEGDNTCLAQLGKLVGAQIVIAGEIGGLGDARVVYMAATDVSTGKELRSTTLSVGASGEASGGAPGAAVRLLDPDRYRGTLKLAIDVTGATVYVNGTKVPLSAQRELVLPVGTQAIRVTHPEYHDFVKFVDVPYNRTAEVPVGMQQYPTLQHDVKGKPTNRDSVIYTDPPTWRRWYVVAPAAIALGALVGVIVGLQVYGFPDGVCRKVGGESC